MAGTTKLMAPYLDDLSNRDEAERFQPLASHLLLTAGTPTNWGQLKDVAPDSFGLATADPSQPYELDIDKVSRLNSANIYSLTYADLWEALGVKDVSFNIEIRTLFEVSITVVSNFTVGAATVYEFEVATRKSGMPVSADLSSYVVVQDFVNKTISSTSSSGVGSFAVSVPNSLNGTALLLVFARARANSQMISFSVYAFGHNSETPLPNQTFTRLSPLDYVLNVPLAYSTVEVLKAQAFSFNHNFSLAQKTIGVQTLEYYVPRLLDSSPMILVLTGSNVSTSFAEWVAYPQLPLQTGADFTASTAGSKIVSQSRIVTIDSVLYEVVTKWGGLSGNV